MKKTLVILLVLFVGCQIVSAQDDFFKPLQVYVSDMPPCVIVNTDNEYGPKEISGFEIELWNAIGKELVSQGLIASWKFNAVPWDEIETNIKNGNADVGCSGLTIRSARMEWADFSVPTMNSGLGIMVLKNQASSGFIARGAILYEALSRPIGIFIFFILLFSHIIWIAERGKDEGINNKYIPGIFEAIYFCVVTCSTVGYGDYTPKKWITKIITIALIFCGIMAFCNFTALLSADYTTEKIAGDIQSPDDLKGKIVLTQKGTTSVGYVKELGAKVKTVDSISSACDNLLLERGDAVVYDYPILLNYVKDNPDKVVMAGGMFDEQYYGFVLSKGSELKRPIDKIILTLYENGTYANIYKKWF